MCPVSRHHESRDGWWHSVLVLLNPLLGLVDGIVQLVDGIHGRLDFQLGRLVVVVGKVYELDASLLAGGKRAERGVQLGLYVGCYGGVILIQMAVKLLKN